MENEGAKVRELKFPGVPGSRSVAEKARPRPPPLPQGAMCPEGRLSGVHVPSRLNGDKVDSEGKVLVCVCMYAVCVHVSVCACVFGLYVCMRVWCVCVCMHVCVPACVHVWH